MAWNRQQVSADDILNSETFTKRFEGVASKDDLSQINSKIEGFQTEFQKLQESLAKLTAPPPPPPDPTLKADADDPTTAILTDPSGFITRQTAGTQEIALQARADVQEMRARQKFGAAFAKFGQELSESAGRFPLNQRAQDTFWDWHISTFMGSQYLAGKLDGGSYPSTLGGSTFGTNTGDARDPNLGFSADQVAFFKERGVPLERAAVLQRMSVDKEQITPANIDEYRKKVVNA